MIRSDPATSIQLGFDFQAGVVICPVNTAAAVLSRRPLKQLPKDTYAQKFTTELRNYFGLRAGPDHPGSNPFFSLGACRTVDVGSFRCASAILSGIRAIH